MMFFRKAKLAGYSSVVGQPIMLLSESGSCIGQLSLIGYQGDDYKKAVADVAGALNEITRLREQLAEARLSELAALGQAQDAYTAQLEAEDRALRVGEAVREAAVSLIQTVENSDRPHWSSHGSWAHACELYAMRIDALDVSKIAKKVQ